MSHDENRPTADFDDERLNVLVTCEMEDGEHFQVPVGLLQQSKTFLNMYNDLGLSVSGLGDDFVFNLPMRGTIFRAIIKWCEEHKGQPDPVITEDPTTRERKWFVLTDFQTQFFDVDVAVLAEYLMAGNFLDLRSLYVYGCQSFAALLKEKTADEIREMLGLEDDLTEEEKEEIEKENVWCHY